MSSNKNWKDYLLSSGLPLEHSVKRILDEVGILRATEFKFTRPDESGRVRTFSVDAHSSIVNSDRGVTTDLFIECKYRHDSVKWVFAPHDEDWLLGERFSDAFVVLDDLCGGRSVDTEYLNDFADRYPMCAQGIELLNDQINRKSIEQCVSQLKYGVVKGFTEALNSQSLAFKKQNPAIHILVPIVVTTAQLWRITSDVTVEMIRNAHQLTDIAAEHDILTLRHPPDNELRNFAYKSIMADLFPLTKTKLTKERGESIETYVQGLIHRQPSVFVIIAYNRFREAIKNLNSFTGNPRLIKENPVTE